MRDAPPTTSSDGPAEVVPVPPEPLRLRVTSDTANLARVRRAVEAYAAATGFDEVTVAEIGLVVNEAMANVIRHAYDNRPDQPIELDAAPVDDGGDDVDPAGHHTLALRLRLRDWGHGDPPDRRPIRGYVPGQPGGLGLVCLRQMMDRVEYAPQPDGGMLLTMTKKKPGA